MHISAERKKAEIPDLRTQAYATETSVHQDSGLDARFRLWECGRSAIGHRHNPDLPPARFQLSATLMVSRPAGEMSSSTTKLLGLSGMQSVAA